MTRKTGKGRVDYFNRVRLLRTERGMSRQALADLVDVHLQTIGYIERGQYNLSLGLALRLSEALGVSLDALFSSKPFEPLSNEHLLASGQDSI